jgi:threonine dehydrogenase-like Zn-dependent dehydrogenase
LNGVPFIGTPRDVEGEYVQALVWYGERVVVEEVPAPVPGLDEIPVSVRVAGVCGSDLHAYRGRGGARRPPLVLGHEAVVEDGDGRRYALFPLIGCGHCGFCQLGRDNLCPDRTLYGLHRGGVFATELTVPRSCLVAIPEGFDDLLAVLVEPLATSLSAVRTAALSEGSRVLVIGCGTIGLMAVLSAVTAGASVVAVDPAAPRRLVAAQLGADVLDSTEGLPPAGFDLVVDAVGLTTTIRDGIRAARPGGRVALLGLGEDEGIVPFGEMVRRGVSLTGQYAYSRDDFQAAVELLEGSDMGVSWLTVRPLSESAELFRQLATSTDGAVKGIIQMK